MEIGGFVKTEHAENGIRVIDEFDLTHMSISPDKLEFIDWDEFDKIVDVSEPESPRP